MVGDREDVMSDCFDHGSEAMDRMLDGEEDYGGYGFSNNPSVACKYCGQKDLEWERNEGKWMLFDYDADKWHKCWLHKKRLMNRKRNER